MIRGLVGRTMVAVMAAAAAVVALPSAFAHDFWIEPSLFRAEPGMLINVHLRVGHAFDGETVARQGQRIEKFIVAGPDGEKDLPGVDGGDPAGFVRPQTPGVYALGYRSRHARSELDPAKFESYLREEGLDRIIDQRAKRGESSRSGRELYSRCAKSLVLIGEGSGRSGCDRSLGFQLELIPQADLLDRAGGGAVTFELLHDGKPCEDVLVHACNQKAPHHEFKARTGKDGRVVLPLNDGGVWMLNAVHMIEAPAGAEAEWESVWASLTFELPPGVAATTE